MNREEAAREIDNTACCFSDKRFRDAMHMAAAALRGPQPDPITGLVPCGCGGRADCNDTGITSKDGKQLWWAECTACGISTYGHQQKGKAKAAWNRSMSGEVVSKTEKTTQEDQE